MLSDYQTLVPDLVRDDAGKISVAQRDEAITLAVQRYGQDRPRIAVEDLTPADAYNLPLPPGWQVDFSDLRSLEFPIGVNPPSYLDQGRWGFYQTPTAILIRTLDVVAVAAGSVRAAYTIAQVVSAVADTIPIADREAVSCWAAALLCDQLAALYSGDTDSMIKADSIVGGSRAQQYAARALSLRKRYQNEIGVNDLRTVASAAVVKLADLDSRGQARLTHPMRRLYP